MYLVKYDNITVLLTITSHFQLATVRVQLQHLKYDDAMVCLPHKDCDRQPLWQRFPPFVKDQSHGLNKISPRWKKWLFSSIQSLVVFFWEKISAQD